MAHGVMLKKDKPGSKPRRGTNPGKAAVCLRGILRTHSSGLTALPRGVSFCRKFAQKTKRNHQVRVQVTSQPLHPESVWHLPALAVTSELWDQPSLMFRRGLCPPAARHDPRERGEAMGGTQTRLLQGVSPYGSALQWVLCPHHGGRWHPPW